MLGWKVVGRARISCDSSAADCAAVTTAECRQVIPCAVVNGGRMVAAGSACRAVAAHQLIGCATQRVRAQWPAHQKML